MIRIVGVSKVFGDGAVVALDDVSLEIPTGSFFTLLGPSGCGKTTLLRLIAGFELPSSGDIELDGQSIGHLTPHDRPVNTVFQDYALFPHMTVAENIGFGLRMLGRPRGEISETTREMLRLVRMEDFSDRLVDQLSGGQQQRVALARALAPHPKVLLLDEPLSALDLKLRKGMQEELKHLQAKTGITFVFVTHDQGEALAMSDQIAVMSAGRVQQIGTPEEIYTRPVSRFVADFIGETNIIGADLKGYEGENAVVGMAAGHTLSVPSARTDLPPGPVSVALRPETIVLTDADNSGAILTGAVEGSTYVGAATQIRVRLDSGETLTALASAPYAPGDRVGLVCEGADLQVLSD